MRLVGEGFERVVKLTRMRRLEPGVRYRLSGFCIVYAQDGWALLSNTLTGQVFQLDEGETEALDALQARPMTLDEVEACGLRTLAEARCLVEESYDECGHYLFLLGVLRTMAKKPDGLESYVIFPTTGCNARCTYCFEQDFAVKTMDDETACAVVDYIDRTRGSGTVRLKWFGGEPLMAASRIDLICRDLTDREVPFTSSIVTNASLMTPELARRARELWRLSKAQVSLDGDRVTYERRKRYLNPARYGYETAMEGIALLLAEGVNVRVRCNYDAGNVEGLVSFVEDVHERFGDEPALRVYFAQLFQSRKRPEAPELVRAVRAAQDLAASYGILGERPRAKESFPLNYCMADAMDRVVVIEPDGCLQNCEHLLDDHRFGNVRDGVTDQARFEALAKPRDVDERCVRCPFLPECTPYCQGNCPDLTDSLCREMREEEWQSALRHLARTLVAAE